MKPKLAILSDGRSTHLYLDGILIGKGVSKLEFSTENNDGAQRATIRLLEVDVESVEITRVRNFAISCKKESDPQREPEATLTELPEDVLQEIIRGGDKANARRQANAEAELLKHLTPDTLKGLGESIAGIIGQYNLQRSPNVCRKLFSYLSDVIDSWNLV